VAPGVLWSVLNDVVELSTVLGSSGRKQVHGNQDLKYTEAGLFDDDEEEELTRMTMMRH
jgi:hypothetical protein